MSGLEDTIPSGLKMRVGSAERQSHNRNAPKLFAAREQLRLLQYRGLAHTKIWRFKETIL